MVDKNKELKKIKKDRIFIFSVIGSSIIIIFLNLTFLAIQYPPSLIILTLFYLLAGTMGIVIIDLANKVVNLRIMAIEKYNDWFLNYIFNIYYVNVFTIMGFFVFLMSIYFTLGISYLSIIMIVITGLIFYKINKPIKKRLGKTKWISKKFLKYYYKFFIVPLENELNKNKINFQKDLIEKINPFSASIYNVKYELSDGVTVTLFTPSNIKPNMDNDVYCWVSIGVKNPGFEKKFKFYRELIDNIFNK